jgi:hypothetical protein
VKFRESVIVLEVYQTPTRLVDPSLDSNARGSAVDDDQVYRLAFPVEKVTPDGRFNSSDPPFQSART